LSRINEHKNAHFSSDNMHEVKGFPNAANGYSYRKNIKGVSSWLRDSKLPNVLDYVNGYDVPPTEVDGDYYIIESPELVIKGLVWQSGTTVRITFVSGYDSTLYAVSSHLTISGAANAVHNGVFVITAVAATHLDVTIADVIDGSVDVVSGSTAVGYVTKDFDAINLANGQTIPRQGLVFYDGTLDLWFGNALEKGDSFYNEATESEFIYNGTTILDTAALHSFEISLTADQILAGTAITIVDALGTNKVISVISAECDYTYVTNKFNVAQNLLLITDTASVPQLTTPLSGTGILQNLASSFTKFTEPAASLTTSLIANKALTIKADATSTLGDGTAKIYGLYKIITI